MRDLTNVTINSLYEVRSNLKLELKRARKSLLNRAPSMTNCCTSMQNGLSIDTHGRLLNDLNDTLIELHREFVEVSNEITKRYQVNADLYG